MELALLQQIELLGKETAFFNFSTGLTAVCQQIYALDRLSLHLLGSISDAQRS